MKKLTLSDFQFPESATIERQVLSDAVFNSEIFPDLQQIINRDMFYGEQTRGVWDMMTQMYNRGEVIDAASLIGKLGKEASYLIFSDKITPGTATTAFQHASILRDASAKRNAYQFALHLLETSVKPETTEDSIAMLLESAENEIISGVSESSSPLTKIIEELTEEIERENELKKQGKSVRIRTGIGKLDWSLYQGWGPGQLIILAARPSVGKTSVMLQFALSAAGVGNPTQIFTLEMTRQELLKKILFSTGFIRPEELANGQTPWSDFEKAVGVVSSYPLFIDDQTRQLSAICSKIRREANRGNCKIAFVDYLGLVKSPGRDQRYREVADITGELKALAKELGIPIIVLCQLSRLVTREDRPPILSDLRESGDIEQDADIVLMLEQTDMHETIPNINLWVRKNRQFNKDFAIKLKPNDSYSKFYEITTEI